jgi:hypothetical protein
LGLICLPVSAGQDICIERIFSAAFMTEEFSCHASASDATQLPTAEVIWLSSESRHDSAIELILPAIASFGAAKNVSVNAEHQRWVASEVLKQLPSDVIRALRTGRVEAVTRAQLAISNTLDIIALGRFFGAACEAENMPVPDHQVLFSWAEQALTTKFANDQRPSNYVWPDLADMLAEHLALTHHQPIELPKDAERQVTAKFTLKAVELAGASRGD